MSQHFSHHVQTVKDFLSLLQVKRDFICLYCNELCHPFSSLEAVRNHMEAKSHCKVHYGDGGDEEDAELEEFYDYSSRSLSLYSSSSVLVSCLS